MNTGQDAIDKLIRRGKKVQPAAHTAPQAETDRQHVQEREQILKKISTLAVPTLRDIATAPCTPKVPIIDDLLFPGAWLLVGRAKIGKSWLLLQMALAVAESGPFLGFKISTPAGVLYIAAEDDNGRIKSRLEALGVANAPGNCYLINRESFTELAKEYSDRVSFVDFLEMWLKAHPDVRLVIIDTETVARQIWSFEASDQNQRVTEADYKQVRQFDELASRRQVAIVLVNHAAKRKGKLFDVHEIINRTGTALAGASGSIALADKPDADPLDMRNKTRVLGIRGRDLENDHLLAVRQGCNGMPYFVSDGVYIEVEQTDAENEVLEALEELMREIEPGKYVSAATLAEHLGQQRNAVKRTITRMLNKGRLTWKSWRITSKRGKEGGLRLEPMP